MIQISIKKIICTLLFFIGLEESYKKCGWKTKIFTRSGVSDKEGTSYFKTDNNLARLEWGGKITDSKQYESKGTEVNLIRLSKFINETVAKRYIPTLDPGIFGEPKVLMKMDIEGSERQVIPDMIENNSFDFIDGAFIEYHGYHATEFQNQEWKSKHPKLEILDMDDESYGTSNYSLPKC